MKMATGLGGESRRPVLSGEDILALQNIVRKMPVAEHVYAYAEKLVRVTRPKDAGGIGFLQEVADVGGGAAGELEPDFGRQGAGDAEWAVHVSWKMWRRWRCQFSGTGSFRTSRRRVRGYGG
jgi:MoxR-like ATPase